MNKRNLLQLYLVGGASALVLAGCTTAQITDAEKRVADVINQVQAGVEKGCAALGVAVKMIPTANSVLQVLISLVAGSATAATVAVIEQAITDIVAIGCPAPSPPTASPAVRTTSKGVVVSFY